MGRPKGSGAGLEVNVGVRMPAELVERVDQYADQHGLKRPAAIREIVSDALEPKGAKG